MPFDAALFNEIEANVESLDIDEIKRRLDPLMIGFHIETPIFDTGAFIYRARQFGPKFRKAARIGRADLVYPPTEKTVLGRLNRIGKPVFYGAMHKEAVFVEFNSLKAGDELIVSYWRTTERMIVNNIGYTAYAFGQLGAKRPVPDWKPKPTEPGATEQTLPLATLAQDDVEMAMSKDDARDLKLAFSKYFTRQVSDSETFRYKLTAAIGELHLGDIINQNTTFSGVLFPSVRMGANGDNIGLQPWFVGRAPRIPKGRSCSS